MIFFLRPLCIVIVMLVSVLSVPTNSYAVNATEEDIKQFILKMQSIMNRRNNGEIGTFFSYFTDSSARFLKTSYLVNAQDQNKILAQESLNMTRDEYIEYISTILKSVDRYGYKITINKIKIDQPKSIALVSYSVDEYSIINGDRNAQNKTEDEVTFISANCNANFSVEDGDVLILSTNCIEKIIRKK